VNDLERAAATAPGSLSALLRQVSERAGKVEEPEDDDVDQLVAASARLRETVEAEFEPAPVSHRAPPVEPAPALGADLDRLWSLLDSRSLARTPTVVLPAAEKDRITPRADDAEVMEGWTQEMLWPTMAGIALVTFALGALFVWVLSRI
jgi:hypothetical protein